MVLGCENDLPSVFIPPAAFHFRVFGNAPRRTREQVSALHNIDTLQNVSFLMDETERFEKTLLSKVIRLEIGEEHMSVLRYETRECRGFSNPKQEKTAGLRPNASAFFEHPDEAFCA